MTDQLNSVERAIYVRPELRHYGAITKLVQGAGGSKGDGLLGMSRFGMM